MLCRAVYSATLGSRGHEDDGHWREGYRRADRRL